MIVEKISQARLSLMALAIIMVVLYHYKCWIGGFPWYIGMILQYGYIGVDFFFFLSGFGLAYSYQKNNLKTFYTNRMKILPCYMLYGTILILHIYAGGKSLSFSEILYKFSTLEYTFEHRGIDWYMSAILQLYLFFPLLYHLVKLTKEWCVVLIVPIVFTISWLIPLNWAHLAMLQRLPAFVLGIYCIQNNNNNTKILKLFILYLIYFILLMLFFNKSDNMVFLTTCLITPISLYALTNNHLTKNINIINDQRWSFISNILGAHTLQIYYGTNLALLSYDWIEAPRSIKTIIFILAFIFGSYLFSWTTIKSNIFHTATK